MNYFTGPLSKYADFSGRARRKEYWMFFLTYIIAMIVSSIIDGIIGFPIMIMIFAIGMIIFPRKKIYFSILVVTLCIFFMIINMFRQSILLNEIVSFIFFEIGNVYKIGSVLKKDFLINWM